VNGRLSAVWALTVRRSKSENPHRLELVLDTARKMNYGTVRGLGADCPQYKNQQHHKTLRNCPEDTKLSAVGPRTVRRSKMKNHTMKQGCWSARSQLPDCPPTRRGLSMNRVDRRTEHLKNCLLTSIHKFAAKSSPTATKLGEHDHKVVGELPLRGHRPI
jgi:hypothetical protein